jgi:membrane associated rhomboid family serine protease
MMLMPYRLDVSFTRIPFANYALIVVTSLMFFFVSFGVIEEQDALSMVLRDWDLGQMLGCLFLHGGLFHLVGNMIFLWVFGNAVCATVGNGVFPVLYFFLGIAASASHLIFSGQPAIGASGAINGIVGMALVLYPANQLHCWYGFSFPLMGIFWKSGKFSVRAYWMILAWSFFDILGIVLGSGGVGYWAHVGGFVNGMVIAYGLLIFKVVETYDPTILDVIAGRSLDRSQYDLNELAAMPLPSSPLNNSREPRRTHQPSRMLGRSSPSSAVPTALLSDPLPIFHVTSVVQKGADLMVFFVNEGDPVRNISLVSPSGNPGTLQPAMQIGKREIGTMRLANLNEQSLGNANLSISYSAGTAKTTKHLIFDETRKTFTAE